MHWAPPPVVLHPPPGHMGRASTVESALIFTPVDDEARADRSGHRADALSCVAKKKKAKKPGRKERKQAAAAAGLGVAAAAAMESDAGALSANSSSAADLAA